ncbi:hypothetical protein SMICM304S_02546 [Streptomyces microflavus]
MTGQPNRFEPPPEPASPASPTSPPARRTPSAVLLPAVSTRTTTTGDELSTLLFGPAPATDAALVLLAEHLDALEREVRTS